MQIDLTQQELSNLHWILSIAKFGSACKNYDITSPFVFLSDGVWTETVRLKILPMLDRTTQPNSPYPSWVDPSYIPKPIFNNLILYGQRDPRWASKPLGISNTTIGDYGCLVTSLGMLAGLKPDAMNQAMVNRNMFYSGNLVSTFDISTINPLVKYISTQGRFYADVPVDVMADLKNHLKANPAILEVDINRNVQGLQQHFVVAVGVDNDKIIILDPWTNTRTNLSPLYGTTDSLAIYRIIKYLIG